MKIIEKFSRSRAVLEKADFDLADENEIYRSGVIGQFNIIFELTWKHCRK